MTSYHRSRTSRVLATVAIALSLASGGYFFYPGGHSIAQVAAPAAPPAEALNQANTLSDAFRNSADKESKSILPSNRPNSSVSVLPGISLSTGGGDSFLRSPLPTFKFPYEQRRSKLNNSKILFLGELFPRYSIPLEGWTAELRGYLTAIFNRRFHW